MGIVDSLLPIFLLIGLGAALSATGFLTPGFLRHLNRLAYYVGMPGLLFVSVSQAQSIGERPLRITAVVLGASLAALAAAGVTGRMMKLPAASMGTFVQAGFRSNLAFVGLPVVLYVFSRPDAPAPASEMVPLIAVAIAPVMIGYNILAVVVLVLSHHKVSRESMRLVLRQVVSNPLVIAIVAGMLASRHSLHLPAAVESTVSALGGIAIPAALFGVGGTIVHAPFRENLAPATAAALMKAGVMPLIGFALARLAGLSPLDVALATMLCATPTAAASFIMSMQLRGDPALASSAIALSTLFSVVPLTLALMLMPAA